jgi:hypothetical protein
VCVKYKYEFVKQEFENAGYTLLPDYYIDNRQKLEYICPEGHKSSVSFSAWFNKGHRCKKCADEKLKLDLDFIKNEFKKESYTLLTKKYKNSLQKLEYVCPEGHVYFITWGCWQSGCRCAVCAKNIKHTIKFVRSMFEKEDYTLITNKYINQKQKLDYICPEGHKHSITWTDWYNGGYRCPTCYSIKISGAGSHNWKGGISCEPYCRDWTKELKDFIRDRDNYQCQNPDCWKKCNHMTMVVHHIDYNKKSCGPENLITICRSCNARANTDRDWHTSWYRAVMLRRYNLKYKKRKEGKK